MSNSTSSIVSAAHAFVNASASSSTRNPVQSLYSLRNVTIHTPTGRVTALSHFDLSFALSTYDYVKLSLEPNHDIFPEQGLVMNVLGKDGQLLSQEPVDRLSHKVFKGRTWTKGPEDDVWIPAGWSRVSIHRDGDNPLFQGVFSVDGDSHHVQTTHTYRQTRHVRDPTAPEAEHEYMVMRRDSDIVLDDYHVRRSQDAGVIGEMSCIADQTHFNIMPEHPVYQDIFRRSGPSWAGMSFGPLFGKRDVDPSTGGNSAGVSLVSTIGKTAGCPTTRKVALVGVAADCTYTNALGSKQAAQQNIIEQMNLASNLYERTFDISLGLANLTIMESECPASPAEATPWNQACSTSFDITARLNTFSAWRGNQKDNNSHWTLLSTCPTDTAVGLAWLGQACVNTAQTTNGSLTGNGVSSTGSETVSGANVVVRTNGTDEWQIIAHETAHTFGAVHDCTSETCSQSQTVSSSQCCPLSANTCDAGQKYVMNPSTSKGISDFSPCSIGNICSALGRNSVRSTCLSDNNNVRTFTGQQCGNGIVEPGEDCDCGGAKGCGNNSCCDATTCKFKSGAVCDDSNDDCCHSCQFSSAGTVCRASTGTCDPQETCSGNSSKCPADVTTPNGQSCGNGLQCASGQCTSRDQQCKTVMGGLSQIGNNTYACDSSSCQLTCASPLLGTGQCAGLMQNFLDGTSCGGGGTCSNGQCKGRSVGGVIKAWIHDNRPLFIGLVVTVGCIILFTFLSCVYRCFSRRRGPKVVTPTPAPPNSWQAWNSAAPPPGGFYYGGGNQSRGPPPSYSRGQPPPPEVSMSGGNGIPEPPRALPRRGPSVRYA
ncbi:ADAM family of metalloprotease-like protein ADM-B [Myriangium duriaei CBS 260.36]|uniref:Disintegrin and metalloproteinase domain-containing protein B n=1 Tax=Myriangium duriaei CBS 260.36 TaxID=1168546 RepID=A0A9P4JE70_9PEZI|nr:ADAM family of metalloprotease-like protein ADM-B [Myriangium duriaei CBS 260.36]